MSAEINNILFKNIIEKTLPSGCNSFVNNPNGTVVYYVYDYTIFNFKQLKKGDVIYLDNCSDNPEDIIVKEEIIETKKTGKVIAIKIIYSSGKSVFTIIRVKKFDWSLVKQNDIIQFENPDSFQLMVLPTKTTT